MIGVNVPIPVPMGYHSFGGWKDSLFGDRHIYGPEGVRFYTRAKVVTQPLAGAGAGRLVRHADGPPGSSGRSRTACGGPGRAHRRFRLPGRFAFRPSR